MAVGNAGGGVLATPDFELGYEPGARLARLDRLAGRVMLDAHHVMAARVDEAKSAPQAPELMGPIPTRGIVGSTVAGAYWLDATGEVID